MIDIPTIDCSLLDRPEIAGANHNDIFVRGFSDYMTAIPKPSP